MKIKLILCVLLALVLILSGTGCNNSESTYKSAMSKHMENEHGVSINSYDSFNINDSGGASASVYVTAQLELGGSADMRNQITVDENCNVSSCTWCRLGF